MSLHGLRNYGFSSWHLVSSWAPLLWYVPLWYCVAVAVVSPTLYTNKRRKDCGTDQICRTLRNVSRTLVTDPESLSQASCNLRSERVRCKKSLAKLNFAAKDGSGCKANKLCQRPTFKGVGSGTLPVARPCHADWLGAAKDRMGGPVIRHATWYSSRAMTANESSLFFDAIHFSLQHLLSSVIAITLGGCMSGPMLKQSSF